MAAGGRQKGRAKTGGRKKGTPNRASRAAKDAILEAFVLLGDVQGLVGWARAHPTDFYCKLLPKVLPKQVGLSDAEGDDIPLNLTVSFVAPSK